MKEWERREMELLRKENAYYDAYTPFEKFIDNDWTYMLGIVILVPACMCVGLLIGLVL